MPEFFVKLRRIGVPPIVDHKHFVSMWPQDIAERLVVRMGQIDGTALLVFKGEQKAMRESIVVIFRAVIYTPLTISAILLGSARKASTTSAMPSSVDAS
jgi:hypothetical protein